MQLPVAKVGLRTIIAFLTSCGMGGAIYLPSAFTPVCGRAEWSNFVVYIHVWTELLSVCPVDIALSKSAGVTPSSHGLKRQQLAICYSKCIIASRITS